MRASAGVRRNLVQNVSTSWDHSDFRVERLLKMQRKMDLALVAASSGLVGFLLVNLHRAMEAWTITGTALSMTGNF